MGAVVPHQRVISQFYITVKHLTVTVDGIEWDGVGMAVNIEREKVAWLHIVAGHVIQFHGEVGIIDHPEVKGRIVTLLNLVSLVGNILTQ